jgi:dihydrodipicolinate synthase/N-acetylneuraminate lyase
VTLDLNGLIPATVLPMRAGGAPDDASLRSYTRWIASQGPVALALNADTGEGPHLTHADKLHVLDVVHKETDVPIVAGISGPFTAQAVQQAHDYEAAGASALLVFPIPAYLSTPLDPAIPLEYHRAIADVGLPLILFQLQPALGGVNFDLETLRQLIELEGVVAMKEASFDARRYLDTFRMVERTDKYRRGDRLRLDHGRRAGGDDQRLARRAHQRGARARPARPATRRRHLRGSGRELPRAAEDGADHARRAGGRQRASAAAADRRG